VFCSVVGDYIDDSAVRKPYYAALKAAGLKQVRFHDRRHTFGTLAVQAFPLSDVKAYMGHADISTTMVYVHHVPQHDAAERLGRVVSGSGDFLSDRAGPGGRYRKERAVRLSRLALSLSQLPVSNSEAEPTSTSSIGPTFE